MIEWINHTGGIWLPAFFWLSVQNTIFLGIIFLLLRSIKNSTAHIKYWLSFSVIIKLLLPPFIGIPLALNHGSSSAAIGQITVLFSQPVLNTDHLSAPVLTLPGILFLVWFSALLIQIAVYLISTLRLQKQLSEASLIYPVFSKDIQAPVYQTKQISVPMTFGIIRPRIYVPILWDQWSDECRTMIIQHEWAHIKRRDNFFNFLQLIAKAIYLFHPLVWMLDNRINRYREMACDDTISHRSKEHSIHYVRALVQIAENLVQTRLICASFSALIKQRNELMNRVQYQLEDEMKKPKGWKVLSGLAILLILAISLSTFCSKSEPAGDGTQSGIINSEETKPPAIAKAPEEIDFVPYDSPPQPVEGFQAIQRHLIYPETARKAGIEGRVIVWMQIGETGEVIQTKVQKSLGPNGCDEAAITAVKAVKWAPAKKDNQPVAVWIAVPIDFKLQ